MKNLSVASIQQSQDFSGLLAKAVMVSKRQRQWAKPAARSCLVSLSLSHSLHWESLPSVYPHNDYRGGKVNQLKPTRVHVMTGGFPPGSAAGHDMDYARLRLLQLLQEHPHVLATVANDFTDIATWLPGSQLLITYVAGPHLNDEQNQSMRQWLEQGGRWLALHGTSGGKAAPVGEQRNRRKMVKSSHHVTLGCFFLNHPPLREFQVTITDREHILTKDLPASFAVMDEL